MRVVVAQCRPCFEGHRDRVSIGATGTAPRREAKETAPTAKAATRAGARSLLSTRLYAVEL